MHKINAIILDWAGTTVDYGCFAPVNAFISAFAAFNIEAGTEETRAPMGMAKRAHVEKMFESENIARQWKEKYGRTHNAKDIDAVYALFEPALFETLTKYTDPIRGVIDCVKKIREMGIPIGSTTGYTKVMMDTVAPSAKEKGYAPDCMVCPEDVDGKGRPYPFMLWRNLEALKVMSIHNTLKIGDTVADIEEALNAGCPSVGVIKGSSMLGLSEKEVENMGETDLLSLMKACKKRYLDAGANYVIDDISELPALIETINNFK